MYCSMTKTIKLIANPVAGRRAQEKILRAKSIFEQKGFVVDLTLTSYNFV